VNRHEVELARLVFHELAHQRVYLKGDSTFNESYATAVERIGLERWLDARIASGGEPRLRDAWREHSARRADFLALLRRHRESLERLFASELPDTEKLAGRDAVFAALQADYAALRERWGGFAGYDRWFGQRLTTAHLASVAAYNDLVPAFEALLAREAGDLTRFHRAAEALAKLPAPQRKQSLAGLAAGNAREPGKIASNRPAAAAP
jgi:predicted aminopeptidase